IGDAGCGAPPATAAIGFGTMSGCRDFALGGSRGGAVPETVINRPSGGTISFRENNGPDQMRIAAGGNVGIGTSTPRAKLDVAGNINIGTGVKGNGGGFKHGRFAFFGLTVGDHVLQVNWPTPFPDANYTVRAIVEDLSPDVGQFHLELDGVLRKTAAGLQVIVSNNSASPKNAVVHVIAVHD